MARMLRTEYPGAWYHVMNRGRRGVFHEPGEWGIYLRMILRGEGLWQIGKCFQMGEYNSAGNVIVLKGKTKDRTSIEGSDSVWIAPCK